MFIYFILNKINGKYYIGKTIRPVDVRWAYHRWEATKNQKKGRTSYFQRALLKYGFHNFEVRIIFVCYDDQTLNDAEKYFISHFNSADARYGYNLTFGGDGGRQTEATRKKRADSMRGRKVSPEQIESIRKTLLGHSVSEETRQKIRDKLTGRKTGPMSDEQKKLLSSIHKGRKGHQHTPEQIGKIVHKTSKWYEIASPNGDIFVIKNLAKFSRENGLNGAIMCRVAGGFRNHHKGYKVRILGKYDYAKEN